MLTDEPKSQLADALAQNNAALSVSEAKDTIDGGDLLAEQVLREAETVEAGGETWVVQVGDSPEFSPPQQDGAEEAQADAEEVESEEDPSPSAQVETDESPLDGVQAEEQETFMLAGLQIDVDPEEQLVGEQVDTGPYGMPKLVNSHPAVPESRIPYFPSDLDDINRDTEEVFRRALALDKPVILEGEAGTGKNQLIDATGAELNVAVYRQEFGVDTTVFDVVGEKDLDGEGGTTYVLGKATKAAMFGGIYVADELNMASGSVTSYLHPLFEDEGKRELELRGTGRTLRPLPGDEEWDPAKHLGRYIHPHFYAVGTQNPLHYADTQEQNDALRSRCTVIEHPYLAESEADEAGIGAEAKLTAAETGADPEDVKPVVRLAAVLREARKKGNDLSVPIGHREIRDTVDLAGPEQEFMSFEEAARVKFVGQASLKQDKQFIEDTIDEEAGGLQ
jgi:nitric oxide reductase NorQ protein